MLIKSFKDFVNEGLSQVRDKKVDHIEDIDTPGDSNKEIAKKTEKYMDKIADECPRCGELPDDCKCEKEDPWSTQNYHRVPKGQAKKSKPKQKFKK